MQFALTERNRNRERERESLAYDPEDESRDSLHSLGELRGHSLIPIEPRSVSAGENRAERIAAGLCMDFELVLEN